VGQSRLKPLILVTGNRVLFNGVAAPIGRINALVPCEIAASQTV
jgi:hypothetical protein